MFRVTSCSDIAGQVSEGAFNGDRVTIGTVYLPSGGVKTIRKQLPKPFPKWRDASDVHVKHVVSVILRESLSVSAGSVDKRTNEWQRFWDDASDTHKKIASIERGSIGFLKAATMIKFILFAHANAAALGHAIYSGMISSRKGSLDIEEAVILDNEIQGQDNREALVDNWRSANNYQPLSNSIGLTRRAKTLQLASEQSEPLLLLADYVAGLVHVGMSQADVLRRSSVTPQVASGSLARLQRSGKFVDFSNTVRLNYFDIYPDFQRFSRRGGA